MEISEAQEDRDKGRRAEEVVVWFLRLNGVFTIQNFVVHPDKVSRTPLAEADVLGIRMSNSFEGVNRSGSKPVSMKDHETLINASRSGTVERNLALIVEVKSGRCNINGPWSDVRAEEAKFRSNMERALGRIGCFNRQEVGAAAAEMNKNLRYESQVFVAQYFSFGREKNFDLAARYPRLIQLTFEDIANFLHQRFSKFPEKLPQAIEIDQWPGFGDRFRTWLSIGRRDPIQCTRAVSSYIKFGEIN
jgi:hypothetical protein